MNRRQRQGHPSVPEGAGGWSRTVGPSGASMTFAASRSRRPPQKSPLPPPPASDENRRKACDGYAERQVRSGRIRHRERASSRR